MSAIHLIKNNRGLPQITPIERGSNIYISGYWVILESKAKELIGEKIFFHTHHQEQPSFFGGVIVDATIQEQSPYEGRIVFTFRSDQSCKGVTTPRIGWSQEMKIVP